MNVARLSGTIFISMVGISISLLFWFLAKHIPMRYLAWFCLMTGAYFVLEITLRKSFSEMINQNRFLGILLELVLGVLFVAAFYWFAAYVHPGT